MGITPSLNNCNSTWARKFFPRITDISINHSFSSTKSQEDHRTIQMWRNFRKSLDQHPTQIRVSYEIQVAQHVCQFGLENPHQLGLHSLDGNLLQCLAVLMMKLSPHVQLKPLNWVCDCKRLKDTYNISQNQPKYILLADLAFCKGLFLYIFF